MGTVYLKTSKNQVAVYDSLTIQKKKQILLISGKIVSSYNHLRYKALRAQILGACKRKAKLQSHRNLIIEDSQIRICGRMKSST